MVHHVYEHSVRSNKEIVYNFKAKPCEELEKLYGHYRDSADAMLCGYTVYVSGLAYLVSQ